MRKDLLRRAVWELAPLWVPVLVFALVIGFCTYSGTIRQYLNHQRFDSERWKQASSDDRYDLAWDLVHGRLDGLSTAEVPELLGEPTSTETSVEGGMPFYGGGTRRPGSVVWYYSLGAEKYEFQIGPSGAVLIVIFENARVVEVTKTSH